MTDEARGRPEVREPAAYVYDAQLPADSAMLQQLLRGTDIQRLFEAYYALLRIPVAIIDPNANVLFSSRWQRICMHYHRVHPETCQRCVESDRSIASQLEAGAPFAVQRCAMGLTDCAAPILLEGRTVANVFIGQFLTEPPDEARFRRQAEHYGFDVADYLVAVRELPVVEGGRIQVILDLLSRMTGVITALSADRKRAEEAQGRLAAILDTIPQGVFWKDPQGRYLGCNAPFARTAGLRSPEEVVGKTDHDLPWGREDAEAYRAADEEVLATGRPRLHVLESMRQADGTRLEVDVSKAPLPEPGSAAPGGVVGILQDVTREKASERALVASEARFRTLLEKAPIAIGLGRNGYALYGNQRFREMWGYPSAEAMVGRPLSEMWASPMGEQVAESNRRRSEGLAAARSYEGVARRQDGSEFRAHLEAVMLDLPDGRVTAAFLTDVTEKHALELQLRQAQKMEAIGRLAGGVAHDFNNLMAVILSYTGFALAAVEEADPLRDDLREIEQAAERAAALTRQLLAFSRKQILEPEVLSLNGIVKGLTKMLRRLVGEHIELSFRPADDLGAVRADAGQIEQILMNLVVNARDAMPRGGRVLVETANVDAPPTDRGDTGRPGPYVMLSVTDTGCGMDAATRERIFEPFFTTKGVGKGTGLGLSTVYGIVKQSGGEIAVQTEVGRGSTFQVYLPRVDAAPTAARKQASALEAGHETVLLVEDEDAVRKIAERILRSAGYRVLPAASAGDALVLWEKHADGIDLLLTDVIMPMMNGHELANRLVEAKPSLEVLYISGYTDEALPIDGLRESGRHFLAKPFASAALLRKLREVFAAREVGR